MKRSSIILLAVIAILIGALLVTLQDASVYATFEMAKKQQPETVTVVATLDLDRPMQFQAKSSLLTFIAIDKEGASSTVIYNQPKPTDFERSEEITLTGHYRDSTFVATEILMKCPSKYTDGEGVNSEGLYSDNQPIR
ncbi:MAG: cytochrome c maturation protein CcmE [Schleiferiaceae bacterium]|nr:cytochrome c maturation protein CcmE [Schleiferiaceae bacterium]